MKKEMNWISVWILMSTAMTVLSLSYFYLSHELASHALSILGLFLLSTILPYIIWKYNQIKFVDKRNIIIQVLRD